MGRMRDFLRFGSLFSCVMVFHVSAKVSKGGARIVIAEPGSLWRLRICRCEPVRQVPDAPCWKPWRSAMWPSQVMAASKTLGSRDARVWWHLRVLVCVLVCLYLCGVFALVLVRAFLYETASFHGFWRTTAMLSGDAFESIDQWVPCHAHIVHGLLQPKFVLFTLKCAASLRWALR